MLEPRWRRWIVENLCRGVAPDVLVTKLVADGIDEALAKEEVATLDVAAWRDWAKTLSNRIRKRDWVLRTLLDLRAEHGAGWHVERRMDVPHDEFFDRYYAENRPVVLRGAFDDWPGLRKWTVPYLRTALGDREVEVQAGRDANTRYERESNRLKARMPFGAYADIVERGNSNDHYMTANNGSANDAALQPIRADYGPLPTFLDGGAPHRHGLFWLGPAGTITPNHHDLTNNLLVQFMGRKLVRLSPAISLPDMKNDLHVYSAIDPTNPATTAGDARPPPWVEVLLLPGEALFIPIGWWHHVVALDASISITFTNFVARNDFHLTHDVVDPL